MRKLIVIALAGSLASGCTFLLPAIANHGAPPAGSQAPQKKPDNTVPGLVGLAIDVTLITATFVIASGLQPGD